MAVSDRVREIETEIDAGIRTLPIWQAPKAEVLDQLMTIYRDAIEWLFVELLDAKTFDASPQTFSAAFGLENCVRGGVLWALKWALEYCRESGLFGAKSFDELQELIDLGKTYEAFVDVLKLASYGVITIRLDENSRIITCYEGGNATIYDTHIIERGRISSPMARYASLTDDADQLTSRWTAGDYRRVTAMLANHAAISENKILFDPDVLTRLGRPQISVSQPALEWLVRPSTSPDCYVFDDLVLPSVIDGQLKWELVSFLETPIVMIGDRYRALSSDLKAISTTDDYMLRLAARIDNKQYSLVSGLREERMIEVCERVLKQCSRPWAVQHRVHCANLSKEADILAKRGGRSFVLQLKSTLRPETPWEVYKRNEDIIEGLRHTKGLIERGVAECGFVVTNGYRGDYTCWAEALGCGIPIATLCDLEVIADDPVAAVAHIESRVGIADFPAGPPERLLDAEDDLLQWKLRLVDAKAPQ